MKLHRIIYLALFSALILSACQTKKIQSSGNEQNLVNLTEGNKVVFLDSLDASNAIITDESDFFFDRISQAEMAIQMKEDLNCESKKKCVKRYKDFLQKDVESFTSEDRSRISEVFQEIKEMLSAINPKLMDRDIVLIKTKAKHYGEGVYYTRENKIVIPKDALDNFDKSTFKEVMLHEFFHVFSRYNEDTRNKLYELIGFAPVNGRLVLPLDLSKRKLLNPDGTTDYMIKLGDKMAYPLLTSSHETFIESKPLFFNYLEFKLYTLLPGEDGVFHVGKEIPFQEAPDFFVQIKDNTNYIIHPDEIMADNFIYAINYFYNNKKLKDFSSQGMDLIENVGKLLKEHQ